MARSDAFARPSPHDGRAGEQGRSLGELFGELSDEARTLIRQELELAKTEMAAKAKSAGKDAGLIGAGAVLAYLGALFVLAAAAIGLGHLIGYGWSTLILGVALAGTGGAIAMSAGRKLQKTSLAPDRTKHNLQETKQWLKHQTH